jgi:hypothetical protein
MKRLILVLFTFGLISIGGLAAASAGPAPMIDNANAQIKVQPSTFKATTCPGTYAINYLGAPAQYVTYRGAWKGTENEGAGPLGLTPYNLTGPFTVKNVVWTINLTTDRGVLTGTAVLNSVSPTSGALAKTYTGPMTLITQGLPGDVSGANGVPARGWINASTFTANAADGNALLANVEFRILPGFAAFGQFGDANASMNIPDYSVITNHQAC